MDERITESVIGAQIDVITWPTAIARISAWASQHESRYVCICNVHSVVSARQDKQFAEVVANADMATPDGAPVAWMLRREGHPTQERINGPDLMWRYCSEAVRTGQSIFLYGGMPETLEILTKRLNKEFPELRIAGAWSPPFRALSAAEDNAVVEQINTSGAGIVWVSLGCPKQERWMAEHRGRINAVMVGVGAAFDYHAGTITRAPLWMQRNGLEWLHRLASEPRRLWRRYLITNSLFIFHALRQVAGMRP